LTIQHPMKTSLLRGLFFWVDHNRES